MQMYLQLVISRKTFLTIVDVLKDIDENSRIRSRIISQRHGSADPDPYQNVKDPQHCWEGTLRRCVAKLVAFRDFRKSSLDYILITSL